MPPAPISRKILGLALLISPAALPLVAQAQTASDHGGNRIEPFRQTGGFVLDGRENRTIACTTSRSWCAELVRSAPDGKLTLVIAPAEGVTSQAQSHAYVLPPNLLDGGGVTLWDNIIVEADGSVLVGLDLSKETRRPGFRSYQRRLLLLRAGSGPGDSVEPVLEAPLSGHIETTVCSSPRTRELGDPCANRFELRALFTLVPQLAPRRPDLIMAVTASTAPQRRARNEEARAPIQRLDGDEVTDPGCTYTRSFYFDESLGRYVPDAPLPTCEEFLQP